VAGPGFEKLVAGLCAGEVGAVLCFDASRLARNGRDWHHLLERRLALRFTENQVKFKLSILYPVSPRDHEILG
jgi:DNA invertase Pin-like site-specific DNA recombinase